MSRGVLQNQTPPLLRPEGAFKGSVGAWLHPRKRLAMMGRAPDHTGRNSPGLAWTGASCAGRLPEASRANVSAASPLLGPSSAELSAQARRVHGARQDRATPAREGTVDRKRALSGRGACLPFGNIAKIRPLLDLGPLGMLIWCGLCSRHSSDRATWYVHRTGRGAKVAFISE